MKTFFLNLSHVGFLHILIFISCFSTSPKLDETNEKLIGTWVIQKSTFNDIVSPVPINTTLEFKSDKTLKYTLPNFDDDLNDVILFGKWTKNKQIVKIEWDDEELAGGKVMMWEIIELTDSKLNWKCKMEGGEQVELYKRK